MNGHAKLPAVLPQLRQIDNPARLQWALAPCHQRALVYAQGRIIESSQFKRRVHWRYIELDSGEDLLHMGNATIPVKSLQNNLWDNQECSFVREERMAKLCGRESLPLT